MLIRSQDKSRLINLDNTRELRFWECAQGFDITDCVCPIGHYSTKAKSMKVLDMIQEAYTNEKVVEMVAYNFRDVPSEVKGVSDAIIKKMLLNSAVFQMPEDGSVEV